MCIVASIFIGDDSVFSPCFVMQYLVSFSSFAIILMRKRDLVVFHSLSPLCFVIVSVSWLFITVPLVGLQYVIVVFLVLLIRSLNSYNAMFALK